jgi:hypothetical protein
VRDVEPWVSAGVRIAGAASHASMSPIVKNAGSLRLGGRSAIAVQKIRLPFA